MSVFDFLPFSGRNREQDTIALLKKQVSQVYASVEELVVLMTAYIAGDDVLCGEKRKSIDVLERECDDVRRLIEETLYSGAFLPLSRSRILDFAEKVDDIADAVQDTAHITKYLTGELRLSDVDSILSDLVGKTKECVKHLHDAVYSFDDEEKVKQLISQVDREEHEVDQIEEKVFNMLYIQDHPFKSLHLYSKLLDFAGGISNRAEDASDTLSLIVLMHKP